ncbi:MAG: nitrilase-related carbon-nitrogen hydrolase [Bacteroidales bacterium]
MRVGFFQFEVKHGDIKGNQRIIQDALLKEKFDLMVLPELFSTGYLFDSKSELRNYAETFSSSVTISILHDICKKTKGCIVGTIPEFYEGEVYNTAIIVGPEGLLGAQQKIHLTTYEKDFFSPGSSIFTFKIKDAIIGVVTCFDLWFPEMSRLLTENKVDIIVCPSAFGGEESLLLQRARVLENRIFSILCNQTGVQLSKKMKAKFRGESRIVSPEGKIMFSAEKGYCLHTEEIDLSMARKKYSILTENFGDEWKKYQISFNPMGLKMGTTD